MSNDYFALYQHPLWQKKRLENLELANYECINCGDKDSQLHVHHKQYFKGRNPWEYENSQLEVLCDICHKDAHKVIDAIKMMISFADTKDVFNLLSGYLHETIIEKSYDMDDVSGAFNLATKNDGVIASVLDYVHPKHQLEIADFIINLSFNKERATHIFRRKFESTEAYDE